MREANTGTNPAPLFNPIQYSEIIFAVTADKIDDFTAVFVLRNCSMYRSGTNPIHAKNPKCKGGYDKPINTPVTMANCQDGR